MAEPNVLIIGGGMAGLTAALELARFEVRSNVVESSPFAGGQAIGFSCKATSACVRCGACLAEDRLQSAVESPEIRILPSSRLLELSRSNGPFSAVVLRSPRVVDPDLCTGCGRCVDVCPEEAVRRAPSPYNRPPLAVDLDRCARFAGGDCTACVDACPESALAFDRGEERLALEPHALILASGFHVFDPREKPYGYGEMEDVITNLELERMLREKGGLVRPSDGSPPGRIAFIQCVGSRDERLGHLWCSRVCCGSAPRTARRLRFLEPELDVTVFYIDIQTFGRDFESAWNELRREFRFIRAVPADAVPTENRRVRLSYFDPETGSPDSLDVDLLVLSVGITPGRDLAGTSALLGLRRGADGFVEAGDSGNPPAGVTAPGTVLGPMGILDAVKSGKASAWRTLENLGMV
ncbi:MAG: 4Fe-4S binding protein [Deltaproteobacteria bacterium]|nr:4Fe-4S binding protein [Deltaproteobacteria bacterium]